MSPLGMAASVGGGLMGAYGQSRALSKGMDDYRNYVGKGTDQMRTGMAGADAAFQPFEATGVANMQGASDAVANRQQAQGPNLSNVGANSAAEYLDPSANYSIDQANKAASAASIAGGGMGGGMMKALTNNANKMAQTNWNTAFDKMLSAKNTNFGQEQQQYSNNNDFQQQQIGNQMNLANMGLTATGQNQQLQLGYNTGINDNYGNIAANQMSGNANKGNVWNNAMSGMGKSIAGWL